MAFAKVIEFRRDRQRRPKVQRRQRGLSAPWLPLAGLIALAGGVWLATPQFPGTTSGKGTLVMNGSGAFALCVGASEQNCVIDGDTIRYGGTKIRLEDIDAPEVSSPMCAAEAARGQRATRRLLELINAGPFQLVRTGDREHDRYGRTLRTIERGGRSLGDTLISEGLARRWDGARRSWCG
jgi:micrococcal nuclease